MSKPEKPVIESIKPVPADLCVMSLSEAVSQYRKLAGGRDPEVLYVSASYSNTLVADILKLSKLQQMIPAKLRAVSLSGLTCFSWFLSSLNGPIVWSEGA